MRQSAKNESKEFHHYLKFVFGSSVLLLFSVFLAKVLNYVFKVVIAREFGPEMFGLFSLALMVAGWFIAFSGFGVPEGLLRYMPIYLGKGKWSHLRYIFKHSMWFLAASSLFFGAIMFFTAEFVSIKIFHNAALIPFLKAFSLVVPITVLAGPYIDLLLSLGKVGWYSAISNIFANVVRVGLLLILIMIGLESGSIIIAHVVGMLSVVILAYTACFFLAPKLREKQGNLNKKVKKKLWKDLLTYSWPIMFLGIISSIFYWIDSFFIGYFENAYSVGIYNAAVPIALLLGFAPSLVMTILFPLINREYSKGKSDVIADLSKQIGKWIFIVNIPIFILIMLFPGAVINLLFGSEFLSAALSLRFLAIGAFFYAVGLTSFSLISMIGKSRLALYDFLVAAVFNIILNILLVPKYGINGAAFSTMLTNILLTGILFVQSKHYLGIIPLRRRIIKIALISLIPMFLLIWAKQFVSTGLVSMLGIVIVFGFAYVAALFLSGSFDENDLLVIRSAKNKIGLK